jgi:aminopeptidase N
VPAILMLLLLGAAATAAAQQPGTEPPPIPAGRASAPGTYGDLDVVHYDLELSLPDPGGRRISGTAVLTLRTTHTGVKRAVLDFTGLAVDAVTVQGAAVRAEYRDGRLSVPLPDGATPADTFLVEVRYEGTPDDGLIFHRNVHGSPGVFADNWPNRARFWFPSVDDPSDKATASFTVHAPASWVVVANGEEVGDPEPYQAPGRGPQRTWRWAIHEPVSVYNLVVGAAKMIRIPVGTAACGLAPASPRDDGCVQVSAWLFPEDTAQASRSFRRAPEMVDYYAGLIGPYAFEKLAHVQSATRFGGMENASAIFYAEDGLAAGRDVEGTVAHETAHQWFGDEVTEADWPELWLSEGFATYFGHLFFEHADGEGEFRRRMEESRRDYLSSGVTGQAVIDRDQNDLFELLNANNYPKGAWVLHMLRGILGDDVFFRGIRDYYARFAGKNATTADLRQVMEAASGQDLRWFFHQWLEEPGYPVLRMAWQWRSAEQEVEITVTQTQDASWPTFRLPMKVEVVDSAGAVTRHEVEIQGRIQRVRLPATSAPAAVRLDPDHQVLLGDPRPGTDGRGAPQDPPEEDTAPFPSR